MFFESISVSNFKSFDEIDIILDKFNILIGPNASGKSNFINIFRYLRDISRHGLDNAISLQGDKEYICNAMRNDPLLKMSYSLIPPNIGRLLPYKEQLLGLKLAKIQNDFAIRFKKNKTFEIAYDKCQIDFMLHSFGPQGKINKLNTAKPLGKGNIKIESEKGKININHQFENRNSKAHSLFPGILDNVIPEFVRNNKFTKNRLLLETPLITLFIIPVGNIFENLAIYDFNSQLMKNAVPIAAKKELETDGKNIALVLKNILANPSSRQKFLNYIKDLLPYIKDIKTSKLADKSLLFSVEEIYNTHKFFPSSFLSDGTVYLTAVLLALFFDTEKDDDDDDLSMIIFEEVGRNIHPSLISKLVNLFKEASGHRQIIVSTHNPQLVKYADPEDLLLVSRNEKGYSAISRPVEKSDVKIFLENEIGIDELFAQDLLGV